MKPVIGSLVACALLLAIHPRDADACRCPPIGSPAQEMKIADAVFIATVRHVDKTPRNQGAQWLIHNVEMEVTHGFKGVSGTRMLITTSSYSGACGFPFTVGERYLVYASHHNGRLTTSACHRTVPLEDARADLDVLSPGLADTLSLPPKSTTPRKLLRWTAQIDALTTARGYVHIQIERVISGRFSIYFGPQLRLFDSVFPNDEDDTFGLGVELGLRWYLGGGAPTGFWFQVRGVAAYVTTVYDETASAGYGSAMIGATLRISERWVLSAGTGIQLAYSTISRFGPKDRLTATHTALGVAF